MNQTFYYPIYSIFMRKKFLTSIKYAPNMSKYAQNIQKKILFCKIRSINLTFCLKNNSLQIIIIVFFYIFNTFQDKKIKFQKKKLNFLDPQPSSKQKKNENIPYFNLIIELKILLIEPKISHFTFQKFPKIWKICSKILKKMHKFSQKYQNMHKILP